MSLVLEPTTKTFESTYRKVLHDLTAADSPFEFDGDLSIEGSIGRDVVVRAAGTVCVDGAVEAANVVCSGEFKVESGSIVGGCVAAYRGVTARQIGDARATPTRLVLGIDELALEHADRRILEILAARQKADAFLKRLSPMLQQVKQLSANQKEQLTELLSQGQELQQRANSATEQLRSRLTAAQEQDVPMCVVSGELFAGVTIIFPGGACEVRSAVKGPLQIQPNRIGQTRTLQIKLINTPKLLPLQPVSHRCKIAELLERLG